MNVKGPFDVTMQSEPPYDEEGSVSLSRAKFDKRFHGALEATSRVEMLAARTAVQNSAGYVALERICGTLEGRRGTFVVVHTGLMSRGKQSLSITIVPDSGTGELAGISGRMNIEIVDGKHFYEVDYSFE